MIEIEKNLDKFITLLKIIKNLTPETNITFNKDSIFIKSIHASNTCLITLTMNSVMFEKYEVAEDKTYLVDVEKLVTIMGIVADKKIKIDVTENGLVMKQGRKKFKLSYYTAEEDKKPRPDIKTVSKWKINSNDFFDTISSIINFSEVCVLEGKDNLTMYSKSNLVDGEVIINAEKISGEDSTSNYDVGFMNNIADIKQVFPEIRIGFGSDEPFIMRGTNDDIDFEFMLAGRVENE